MQTFRKEHTRHFRLSLTSGPVASWRHVSAQGNKLGQYHCNNRHYDIRSGRWISPDQASSPWFDLFDYVGHAIVQFIDATGLTDIVEDGVRTGANDDYKYTLEGCECCVAKPPFTCEFCMDWFKDMLSAAYRILTRATYAADNLKKARDAGKKGDMEFPKGSDEAELLKNFDWDNIPPGKQSDKFIRDLQENLDEMWRKLDSDGWHIVCESEGKNGRYGHTYFPSVHWLFGDAIYINCDKDLMGELSGKEFVDTLLHELSHNTSTTGHDEDGDDPADDADLYGKLAKTFGSEVHSP